MGDMSPMISAPLLSDVTQRPNGVSPHSFNNTDDLEDDTSNASLYLINQIASSLSNPQTMNVPSAHRRLSATLDRQHEPVTSALSCDTRTPSLEDSASFLPSYKRVSKLNKRNPVISCMLEENPQFVIEPLNTQMNPDSARIPLADFSENPIAESTAETADDSDPKEHLAHEVVEDYVREEKAPVDFVQEVTSAQYDSDPLVSDLENSTEPMDSNTPMMTSRKDSEVTDDAGVFQAMDTTYSHPPLSHTTSSSSARSALEDENDSSILLIEKRSFRPFKNPEDYLYAMREDLAEWLNSMYELDITADNFFEKLETGEVLCQHANSVRVAAEEAARNGRRLSGRWSVPRADVVWRPGVEPGSFRARDNVSNFIRWCRQLGVHEVLLFETDDLVLRKNEKHVILALLEVARQGYKLGMAAPLLVQMEDDIDRHERLLEERRVLQESLAMQESLSDSQEQIVLPAEPEEPPQIFYGPTKQIVTNDLRSLDEMVRDLVERCACPSQFPMVKVSDGKYRIGDTKVLIFVRILRNHVMVRVGGGWDTLEHYLDKHDPCRCRSGHRATVGAQIGFKTAPNSDRQLSSVTYERCEEGGSPVPGRRRSSAPPRRDSGAQQSLRQRSQSPANVARPVGKTVPQSSLAVPEDGGGKSPEPQAWCDSSSEVSDEGYRSQGAPRPSPRSRRNPNSRGMNGDVERPESSMTHTSSEGSTVSADDFGSTSTPPRSPSDLRSFSSNSRSLGPQAPPRSKNSPANVAARNAAAKKKKTSESSRPAWNSGSNAKNEEPKRRGSCADLSGGYPIGRSRSTNSENGFQSLSRNVPARKSLSASRPSKRTVESPIRNQGTWNGRSSRGRTAVNSDMYRPPASPRGVRSASASPGPARRNFGHSAPVTPQTRSPKTSAPNSNLASPTQLPHLPNFLQQQVSGLSDVTSKPSVEMLQQLENLVNSYRVKVLDHFAEEGKEPPPQLADDFSCSWVRNAHSLTNSPKKSIRPQTPSDRPTPKLTPRRDGMGSRIPAPTYYSARNTPS